MKEYGGRAYIKTHPKLDNGKPWVEVEVSASGSDLHEVENFVSKNSQNHRK
jgi:hypothetical protein